MRLCRKGKASVNSRYVVKTLIGNPPRRQIARGDAPGQVWVWSDQAWSSGMHGQPSQIPTDSDEWAAWAKRSLAGDSQRCTAQLRLEHRARISLLLRVMIGLRTHGDWRGCSSRSARGAGSFLAWKTAGAHGGSHGDDETTLR